MPRRKRPSSLSPCDLDGLVRRLRDAETAKNVPLLVVRIRDLERIAWREGRAAARAVERRSLRSFVETAARALRATDLLGHDDESADFVALLVSPTRQAGSVATPADCRATLARLASAVKLDKEMQVETGWTLVDRADGDDRLASSIEGALERGARERERYAFFSTIGHELRTPLTSIRGYLETLLEDDLDAATTRRFLEVARNEALRMSRLVEGMFDVSMLDLRAGPSRDESCLLTTALGDALYAVAPFAAARRTTLTCAAASSYKVAIAADRLAQITINILENAIKHGRDGGNVALTVAPKGARYVEIRIDDDGPGVVASERQTIFALAKRGSNASSIGTGIGLAVVALMVERVGGEVDVTDSLLGGAQFRVRLPLMVETSEARAALAVLSR